MSEKENMLAGLFYNASDPQLKTERTQARRVLQQYNASDPADEPERQRLLTQLLGAPAPQGLHIEAPFYCDYGTNLIFGSDVFINFNCVILDCAKVEIGQGTQIGPAVQIYTATHPLDPKARLEGKEFAAPVKIGKNVWIGGDAVILPSVTIGDGAVIGAGAVVKRDVPAFAVAVGNPARVIRQFYDFKKEA